MSPLSDDLDPFSLHLFNAKWQYCQYKSVSSKIPIKTVIFCEEFAENYTCRPQDAPQACHWNNSQCTIHPIVATYNCPVENCSVIFISDDLTHDHHFVCSSMQLLKEEGLEFDRLIHFSDGAPTQYKNRIAFVDCSYATEDLGVKSERHFFGSRHGKGPCDHEIGVIKKSVRIAVAARQDEVASPRDLSDICKKKRLCLPSIEGHHHTKRRFVFVDKTSIVRERPEQTATKSLKNTRKLHCISGIQPYVLSVRERSCFCSGCRGGNLCLHAELAGPWNVCNMSLNARCQPPVVDQTPTPLPVDDTTLSSVHDQSTSHLTIENQAHPVDQDHTSQSENMHRCVFILNHVPNSYHFYNKCL